MKFPECTVISINLPNELLANIDALATKRILNRSACIRELVTDALTQNHICHDRKSCQPPAPFQ